MGWHVQKDKQEANVIKRGSSDKKEANQISKLDSKSTFVKPAHDKPILKWTQLNRLDLKNCWTFFRKARNLMTTRLLRTYLKGVFPIEFHAEVRKERVSINNTKLTEFEGQKYHFSQWSEDKLTLTRERNDIRTQSIGCQAQLKYWSRE